MPQRSPKLLHVLIVDDESLVRWSMSETLTEAGWDVAEACNAKEALLHLSAAPAPDVILLDYRLPDSSDLTLLENIRRAKPKTPVIMLTAYATPAMHQAALERGAFRVVSKPIDMQEVVLLVQRAYDAAMSQ